MKPGSRAEFDFEQADRATIGAAEPATQSDHPAAVLLVPDPESRSGWREFYVPKAHTSKRRPIGFGRGPIDIFTGDR